MDVGVAWERTASGQRMRAVRREVVIYMAGVGKRNPLVRAGDEKKDDSSSPERAEGPDYSRLCLFRNKTPIADANGRRDNRGTPIIL